jgi:transposase
MAFFVGLDWAKEEHAVCVVDEAGRVLLRVEAAHTAAGLEELLRKLAAVATPEQLPIAIERPSGLLVDILCAAGYPLFPMHPNAVKACRSRYKAAPGRTDPSDAYMLADILRTDGHRFHRLKPLSDSTRALRVLVRTRQELVRERVAIANQLRSLLESFWAGAALVFAEIDSAIAIAFVSEHPTPSHARRLDEKRLQQFLKAHAYSGRRSAAELLARLHNAPVAACGELEMAANGEAVLALLRVLKALTGEIRDLTKRIERAFCSHQDGATLGSFPYAGKLNAAQILSELGDVRERYLSADHLAAEAGVAPVTISSGKYRGVAFRWACNKRLRQAITVWADLSRHGSSWAATVYAQARARGCDHPHAIRILARAWIRILWRCWQDRRPYDPTLHHAACGLNSTMLARGA